MDLDESFEAKITVERSKFFAILAPAASLAEIKALLAKRRRTIKKANHHCWAARLGSGGEHARDDGEVGKPGQRILEVLRQHELFGVLIVSRVYGGVKLGPAGVGRAFRNAARQVVEHIR
ncbi:MAG: YigZ family protein [Myxococcota bacterium]